MLKKRASKYHAANKFTGGDSVITVYYLIAKVMGKCKCTKNHSAKYKTMMDCLQYTDTQQKRQIVQDQSEKPPNGWKARARLF